MVVETWWTKDFKVDTSIVMNWGLSSRGLVVADFLVLFRFLLLLMLSWPYTQHPFPFKNTKQVIDNDCHCDPMWSCCKAAVILITYTSRDATRHGSPKAAGMRREPSCIMANALLWSDLWNAPTWRPRRLYSMWFRQRCHIPCKVLAAWISIYYIWKYEFLQFSIYATKPAVLLELCWMWGVFSHFLLNLRKSDSSDPAIPPIVLMISKFVFFGRALKNLQVLMCDFCWC